MPPPVRAEEQRVVSGSSAMPEKQSLQPLENHRKIGVFSPGIFRIPHLAAFLDAERIVFMPSPLRRVDAVVGWARKKNTAAAQRYANEHGVAYLALEDGFLRSVGLGVHRDPPLSMVVDDLGIHYDATRPSRLERILAAEDDALSGSDLLSRARRCIEAIREARLSKYNTAPVRSLGARSRPRVLVVDQTAGDLSVALGMVGPGGLDAMLKTALDEHPSAEIVVKTHPDVVSGKKRGFFGALRNDARVRVLSSSVNPIALLDEIDHVYVATSLLGFEALMMNRPVSCFGMPFYAGWGLTDDRAEVPSRRRRRRTIEEVFAAAYLLYTRYVDPERGERCEIERVIEHLALQRRMGEKNSGVSVCVDLSVWKRAFVPSFLWGPDSDVTFAPSVRRAHASAGKTAHLIVWGSREDVALALLREPRTVWRMEDGFLRSVGLGSDLHAPASLVLDKVGIYYDPRRPSDLENILQRETFTREELERAGALRERIVREGVSKYNVGARGRVGLSSGDRTIVLVVGQVEDDASIELGCIDVRRNEELVREVRRARPDAFIVYKPHPDVVSGNRKDSLPLARARRLCDEVVIDASLADCLFAAHEVHTMTSLVGFEALLRGLSVHAYGQPFYAGWGLTHDRHPHPRRTRRLTIDELVAGALLRYPRYVHPITRRFTTPEAILDYLVRERARGASPLLTSWPVRQAHKLANLAKVILSAP